MWPGQRHCGRLDVGDGWRSAKLGQLGLKSGGGFLAWAHPVHECCNGARRQMVKKASFWVSHLRCVEAGTWWGVGVGRPRGKIGLAVCCFTREVGCAYGE
jgi:hypothetical protein